MAAPTTAARVKKTLANPEPSTHGPTLPSWASAQNRSYQGEATISGDGARRVNLTRNQPSARPAVTAAPEAQEEPERPAAGVAARSFREAKRQGAQHLIPTYAFDWRER